MHLLWVITIRLLYLIIGVLCFYLSIAYEGERKRIENLLDPLWRNLLKRTKAPLSRLTIYLRTVARLATHLFDRLFGRRLLSIRVVGISVSLSLASLELATTPLFPDLVRLTQLSRVTSAPNLTKWMWIIVFILAGILPTVIKRRRWMNVWSFGIVVLVTTWAVRWDFVDIPSEFYFNALGDLTVMLMASFGCDVIFILVLRKGLRYAAELKNPVWIGSIALGGLALAGLVAFLPFAPWWFAMREVEFSAVMWKINLFFWRLNMHRMDHSLRWFYVFVALPFVGATNMLDLIAASFYFFLAALMLVHPLLWAVAKRVIALLENGVPGVVRKRKLWASLCVYFLVCTFTGKFELFELLERLHIM